jgi:hypothetical protein
MSFDPPFIDAKRLAFYRNVASLWENALTVGSGIVLPLEHVQDLVDLVAADVATPS